MLAAALVCSKARPEATVHTTPMEIIHNKPFVMITINGKGPFRFVIDTGTGGEAFISAELAAQLALPSAGHITLNDPSGRGGRKVPLVAIDSMEVAGVAFTGIKAAVHNLGHADGACDGLLGFALFRDYLLMLDYPGRRMTLASGNLTPDGERSVLPFHMPDGIPVVTLSIGAMRMDAQLDSGGSGLSIPTEFASRLKFSTQYASLVDAHSLSTRFTLMGAKLATDVHLGAYTFKQPFVEISPAFPLANFGSGPMHAFALCFDQKNRLVSFQSPQTTLRLTAAPVPTRLQTEQDRDPVDPRLIPLG
jgi:hypothetical protein